MKPLYVSMQAFGPYLDRQEVDFAALENQRIFLISGPTGGGKTAILDAMSFALYGKATGGQRSFSQMRSSSAPDGMDTEITFVFRLQEDVYRFCQSLHIHHKRASGEREEQACASCYRGKDGEWELLESRSPRAVSQRAEELLGFSHDQFSQLIVLPQGEFRRFLLAGSTEREGLLQKLFRTQRWNHIGMQIDQMAKELTKQATEVQGERQAIFVREQVNSLPELRDRVEERRLQLTAAWKDLEVKTEKMTADTHNLEEARRLDQRFALLEETVQKKEKLLLRREEENEKRRRLERGKRIKEVLPYANQVSDEEVAHKSKKAALEKCAAAAAAARREAALCRERQGEMEENKQKQRRITLEIAAMEHNLESAKRLEKIEEETLLLDSQIELQQKNRDTAAEKRKNAEEKVKAGAVYLEQLQTLAAEEGKLYALYDKEEEQVKNYQQLAQENARLSAVREQREKLDTEEKTVRLRLSGIEDQLERAAILQKKGAAAMLAQTLEEGTPCPVCGALHHPLPAIPVKDIPPAEQVELLEKERDRLRISWENARLAVGFAEKEEQDVSERVQTQKSICLTWNCGPKEAEEQKNRLEQQLGTAREARETIPRAKERLELRRREGEEAQRALNTAETLLGELRERRSQARAAAQQLYDLLPLEERNPNSMLHELEEKKKQLSKLEDELSSFTERMERTMLLTVAAEQEEESARAALEESDARLTAARDTLARQAAARGLEMTSDFMDQAVREEELARLETWLVSYDRECQANEAQHLQLLSELSKKQRPNLPMAEERARRSQEEKAAADQEVGGLQNHLKLSEQSFFQLTHLEEKSGRVEKKYRQVVRVQSLIGRKNPLKMPLSQFVVGLMLDDILNAANLYLEKLSRGRYQLYRMTGDFSGGGSKGLELEAFDAHSGSSRPVATLSGGEMFLASLSLAFGLADVVQRSSGGVGLDSIFIDEGFGTLDDETRDAVMLALQQIRQSGRMVGLISHVAELKELIGACIEVYREESGNSRVRITSGV